MTRTLMTWTASFLALAAACTYVAHTQPETAPVSAPKCVMVDDLGQEIYDEFDVSDDFDDPAIEPVTPATGDRILVFGDSEACAVGAYADDKAWRTKAGLGNPDDVVGVWCKVSTTVEYWGEQGHMKQAVDDFKPNVVVVFLGTNHYGAKKVPDVGPILDLVRDKGLRCVWAGNTAVKGKQWAINGLMRTAVSPACLYFDTEAAHVQLADGVHPGPKAAQRWLKDVWRTIPPKE